MNRRKENEIKGIFGLVVLVFLIFLLIPLSKRIARPFARNLQRQQRFVTDASHELKTPVSSIQGYLETIVNHPELDPQKRQLFIERSYLQALRLTDLISDLRSDLTQVTGQDCSSMPFVIGKIYRNPAYSAMSQIETIRAAQEQAAQTLVNVATVDCTGLAQQDGWHYTADAQLYLGEQFVQKVTGMDGKYWVSCASDYIDFSGGGAKQQGETVTITVSARRGYRIEDVTMQIGMQEPVSVTLTNGRYTFVMPESNVSFTVNAQALELYQLTKYESNDASMGSIYPSAEARAGWYEGEQVQIFVRPAEGYTVARATVNGTEIAAVGEQNDGLVYELNVAADAEFYVEFASEQTQPDPPEEPSDETPENNPNTGLWVGIGVGGAVIVAAAVALVVIFVRKRK